MKKTEEALTMGSLFDGIGGFTSGGSAQRDHSVWASEIEAFPIEVTKLRFPEMVHVGDITQLDGAKLPPVHIICGGLTLPGPVRGRGQGRPCRRAFPACLWNRSASQRR